MTNSTMAVMVPEKTRSNIDEITVWASEITVVDDQERVHVLEIAKGIKEQKKTLEEIFNPNIQKAHQLHKDLLTQKKQFTDRLDDAVSRVKKAVLKYDREQDSIREKEQRRLQAIADENARRERERLLKEADKLKTPELAEARREEAEMVSAPVVQVQETPKVKGVSKRVTWKVRVTDISEVPMEYMEVNMKALNALAKATKGNMKIPGVEFYPESLIAI